ncbi:DUF4007 family protein [Candidatus Poriferisocius sp.]|uniref:DUF4007 family protein n=1 Tax=Candidatus Poriferisocius sp. TaxID=3101276 RepID=UPI003B020987
MRLADAAKPVFARHETFHPRYGWFRKAFEAASHSSEIFSAPNATVELGVGKNMVKSIRFWGMAAKLIQDHPDPLRKRAPGVTPTPFGELLFGPEKGWDPYMEDPATLWLLHWKLLAPRCYLPVWWVAFNEFNTVEFDVEELELACAGKIGAAAGWEPPHLSSLRKDVNVLLRTYAPAERTARSSIDDLLDCPLRELGLIGRSPATGKHRFVLGVKASLPPAVVAYAILDFVAQVEPRAKTVLLSRMADEPGAPGRAFRLSETELADALAPAVNLLADGQLTLTSPAGVAQLAWKSNPSELARNILTEYYVPGFDSTSAPFDELQTTIGVFT